MYNHLNFIVIPNYFPIDFASLNLFSEIKNIKEIEPYDITESLTEFGKLTESYSRICDQNANIILDSVKEEFKSKISEEKGESFPYLYWDKEKQQYYTNDKCNITLHQIEMWLCEFQKYWKMIIGQGKQRSKFKPRTKELIHK